MNQREYRLAKQSMQENHEFLITLGQEKRVGLIHHNEEELIKQLMDLMPKSTTGKIALGAIIALVAHAIIKK